MASLEDKIRQVMEMDVSLSPTMSATKGLDSDKEQVQMQQSVGDSSLASMTAKTPSAATTLGSHDSDAFAAALSPTGRSTAPAPRRSVSPGSKLYEKAVEQRAMQEKKREEAIKNSCTFSPKLISNKKLRNKTAAKEGDKRFDQLYEDATKRQLNLAKKAEEVRKATDGTTFKPQINSTKTKTKSKVGTANGAATPDKAADRLYMNAKAMEEKRKQAEETARQQEQQQYSFQPKITNKAKRVPSPGRTARMNALYEKHKEKEARMKAAQGQHELEGCTFKPQINRQRRASTGRVKAAPPAPPSAGSVADRLLNYNKEMERKREELRKQRRMEEKKDLTFKPKITSRPPSPKRAPAAPSGAIHDRLYSEAQQREARIKEEMEKRKSMPRPSSAPKSRSEADAVFNRLSAPKPVMTNADYEEQRAIRELQECTFKPRINSSGKQSRGKNEPLWERLHKEGTGVAELREELKVQQEMNYPFKPNVSAPPPVSPTPAAKPVWERLNAEQAKLKAREEQLEKLKAEKELEGCTFQPKISAKTPDGSKVTTRNGSLSPAGSAAGAATTPIWDRLAVTTTSATKAKEKDKIASPTSAGGKPSSYLEKVAKSAKKAAAAKKSPVSAASPSLSSPVVSPVSNKAMVVEKSVVEKVMFEKNGSDTNDIQKEKKKKKDPSPKSGNSEVSNITQTTQESTGSLEASLEDRISQALNGASDTANTTTSPLPSPALSEGALSPLSPAESLPDLLGLNKQ